MSLARAALLLLAAPASALRHRKANSSSGGYIVTMGDSYSSGTGIHKQVADYHEGNECCRDFKTTPGAQLAEREGTQHIMPACAGDELPQIREQFAGLQADYPDEAARGWEGSTIMFTIGGNDIRSNAGDNWPAILGNCIVSFSGNCHEKSENQVANFEDMERQLGEFYGTVARGASKATIRVWGYPRLLQRTWHCIPVPGVSGAATQWMDDMVDQLNVHIAAAVAAAKSSNPGVDLEYVDVKDYLTKGACTSGGNHVHGIVLAGGGLSPMAFHPSQNGYNEFYNSLANSLGRSLPPSSVWPGPPELWFTERILQGWDSDHDGKLSIEDVITMGGEDAKPEVTRVLRRLFREADRDQDEHLSLEEFEAFLPMVETEAP